MGAHGIEPRISGIKLNGFSEIGDCEIDLVLAQVGEAAPPEGNQCVRIAIDDLGTRPNGKGSVRGVFAVLFSIRPSRRRTHHEGEDLRPYLDHGTPRNMHGSIVYRELARHHAAGAAMRLGHLKTRSTFSSSAGDLDLTRRAAPGASFTARTVASLIEIHRLFFNPPLNLMTRACVPRRSQSLRRPPIGTISCEYRICAMLSIWVSSPVLRFSKGHASICYFSLL